MFKEAVYFAKLRGPYWIGTPPHNTPGVVGFRTLAKRRLGVYQCQPNPVQLERIISKLALCGQENSLEYWAWTVHWLLFQQFTTTKVAYVSRLMPQRQSRLLCQLFEQIHNSATSGKVKCTIPQTNSLPHCGQNRIWSQELALEDSVFFLWPVHASVAKFLPQQTLSIWSLVEEFSLEHSAL